MRYYIIENAERVDGYVKYSVSRGQNLLHAKLGYDEARSLVGGQISDGDIVFEVHRNGNCAKQTYVEFRESQRATAAFDAAPA